VEEVQKGNFVCLDSSHITAGVFISFSSSSSFWFSLANNVPSCTAVIQIADNTNNKQTAGDKPNPTAGGSSNKSPTETGAPTGGSSESPSSSGGGLSIGAMVGIAAAALSVIIGLIGLGFKYKSYRKQKEQTAAVKAQTQGYYGPPGPGYGHGHGYPPPPAYQPQGRPYGNPPQQQGNNVFGAKKAYIRSG
jgi:hypothetical protein